MSQKRFPDGFLWGAATSSHQVEGGNVNDWSKWEDEGHVANGEKSGKAADSWNLYETDFDLLEELNLNAYRFSIEWSRIEPKQGEFDEKTVLHYRKMLESLKKRNIEPIVTLHHFTNPLWLSDWTHKENVGHFINYVEKVVSELGEHVNYWCTINEPMNQVLMGYAADFWPPQYKSPRKGLKAAKILIAAHNQAYSKIHQVYNLNNWPKPEVGIALQLNYFTPNLRNYADMLVNRVVRFARNHYYLKRVAKNLDFVGLNYYFTFHTRWNSISSFTNIAYQKVDLPKSDLGWNIEPEGIYRELMEIHNSYGLPIIVTENGVADAKDRLRKWYIVEHLKNVHRAISDGANVKGYLHWSLIDNFEWADGYAPKFGLVAVNFDTQERTVRESAWTYGDIAKANAISADIKVQTP